MKTAIVTAILTLVLAGCARDNPTRPAPPFQITVRSEDGEPIEGASVDGGFDWTSYHVLTNAAGVATLPGSSRRDRATIRKTNYLPAIVAYIGPSVYTLKRTAQTLTPLGEVAGRVVRFGPDELITLEYMGNYHRYSYGEHGISELYSQQLDDRAVAIKEIQVLGDSLWFTTHESGIFVYSIRNPSSPTLLFHLPVPGYLGPFAVKDSIIVLGDQWEPGPLRILSYRDSGQYRELSRLQNYYVRDMARIGDAAVFLGGSESLPTVCDISNPRVPVIVYNGMEWDYTTGFFYKEQTILRPRYGYNADNIQLDYKVLDCSRPATPRNMGTFAADSWITGMASDNCAFGVYYYDSQTISVLSGSLSSRFRTVATVSEEGPDGVGGAYPPYFVIGSRLWKLTAR